MCLQKTQRIQAETEPVYLLKEAGSTDLGHQQKEHGPYKGSLMFEVARGGKQRRKKLLFNLLLQNYSNNFKIVDVFSYKDKGKGQSVSRTNFLHITGDAHYNAIVSFMLHANS